jgi:Mg2+ and Co2+ transporter CorA
MSFNDILLIINTGLLFSIVGYIYVINKYLNKNDIVEYVSQIFKSSEANLKQDLYSFLEEVKKEYSNHQNEILKLLQEQREEAEKLKKVIINEGLVFKQYCQERIEAQEKINNLIEKRISDSQKHIAMLENKLDQYKRKIERLKNDKKNNENKT